MARLFCPLKGTRSRILVFQSDRPARAAQLTAHDVGGFLFASVCPVVAAGSSNGVAKTLSGWE